MAKKSATKRGPMDAVAAKVSGGLAHGVNQPKGTLAGATQRAAKDLNTAAKGSPGARPMGWPKGKGAC